MAKGTREIRRKIKSIKSTRQITKAMELVAASKMRRAVANTIALRPYSHLARLILTSLSDKTNPEIHPLLQKREVKKILILLITTDRGLCGGLNTQLLRKVQEYLQAEKMKKNPAQEISFAVIGKKGQNFAKRMGYKITAAFKTPTTHPTLQDILPISKMIINEYIKGTFDKVILIYTDFLSAIAQKPTVRRLLPLSRYALEEMIEGLETKSYFKETELDLISKVQPREYIFEPDADEVLSVLLPRLTEMQIYQAILEATASEHSARMFAMRNATENADEFIADLTFTYNQLRQAGVTAELAEISAARAALG